MTCGNGTQLRRRVCVTECGSDAVEYRECNMGCCPGNIKKHPVDGLYNTCLRTYSSYKHAICVCS